MYKQCEIPDKSLIVFIHMIFLLKTEQSLARPRSVTLKSDGALLLTVIESPSISYLEMLGFQRDHSDCCELGKTEIFDPSFGEKKHDLNFQSSWPL